MVDWLGGPAGRLVGWPVGWSSTMLYSDGFNHDQPLPNRRPTVTSHDQPTNYTTNRSTVQPAQPTIPEVKPATPPMEKGEKGNSERDR